MSAANRQTQSKDLVPADAITDDIANFRVAIRFFDEHGAVRFSDLQPRSGGRMQPTAQAVG